MLFLDRRLYAVLVSFCSHDIQLSLGRILETDKKKCVLWYQTNIQCHSNSSIDIGIIAIKRSEYVYIIWKIWSCRKSYSIKVSLQKLQLIIPFWMFSLRTSSELNSIYLDYTRYSVFKNSTATISELVKHFLKFIEF